MLEALFNRLAAVPHDKLAHAAYAVPVYAACAALLSLAGVQQHLAECAALAMLALAAGKELYDWLYNRFVHAVHGVELADFLATAVGTGCAYVCTWVSRL